MTGDERLAKVAEVLAGHQLNGQSECDCDGQWRPDDYQARHQADALASLLEEFRAEGEARALREASAEWASKYDRLTREQPNERKSRAAFRMASVLAEQRAALAAAEPDAGAR